MDISTQEIEICLRVLQQISENPSVINNDERMKALIAKIHTQGKKGQRRTAKAVRVATDRDLRASTVLVQKQHDLGTGAMAALAPPGGSRVLSCTSTCYICKQPYSEVHWFYHLLCPRCSAFNWEKRQQRVDLHGRTALITGGRIKIGFQVALGLLRDGAHVLLTTRFPQDAARRFEAEPDAAQWRQKLQIFGLDLRDLPLVESFADELLKTQTHLDIVIHNAAQTVKRPLAFYQHLLEGEDVSALPEGQQESLARTSVSDNKIFSPSVLLERHPLYPHAEALEAYFPTGTLDADGQQFDGRPQNSWRLRLEEVSTVEMLEVQLVNAVAPFVLNSRLKPLLERSPHPRRFIINVSAMEGQFSRQNKTCFHPHTNMAKAAMNMMTRTCASGLAREGIYMNSVDTGWITDENPHPTASKIREEHGFYTPLDATDGAARIYDPIVQGISSLNEPLFGHFLKDYVPYPW